MATPTILESLKTANDAAGVRTFRFNDLRTEESFLNSGRDVEDLPLHLLPPFNQSWVWHNGRIVATAQLQGFFLTTINQDPNLYRKDEIESEYLEPMRRLCKAFFKNLLNNTQVIDPESPPPTIRVQPEYMFLNHGSLFGISYQANIAFQAKIC
jgi:hypothetical protein